MTSKISIVGTVTVIAISAALALAGCSSTASTDASATPKPRSSVSVSTAPAPAKPTAPTPAPSIDPMVVAQLASGLSPERYSALTAQVAAMNIRSVHASADSLAATYNKPVGVIMHYTCPNPTDGITTGWGINGAFFGSGVAPCGHGDSASADSATIEANRRAAADSLNVGDYILVYVDMTAQNAR